MFLTPLDVRCYSPGEWVVLAPLIWRAWHPSLGVYEVLVPRGFISDFASVPRPLRGLVETDGLSRRPAVLHDWLYCGGEVRLPGRRAVPAVRADRAFADELLRSALEFEGAGWLHRNTFYAGVRVGGWRYWNQRRGQLRDDDFVTRDFWSRAA